MNKKLFKIVFFLISTWPVKSIDTLLILWFKDGTSIWLSNNRNFFKIGMRYLKHLWNTVAPHMWPKAASHSIICDLCYITQPNVTNRRCVCILPETSNNICKAKVTFSFPDEWRCECVYVHINMSEHVSAHLRVGLTSLHCLHCGFSRNKMARITSNQIWEL